MAAVAGVEALEGRMGHLGHLEHLARSWETKETGGVHREHSELVLEAMMVEVFQLDMQVLSWLPMLSGVAEAFDDAAAYEVEWWHQDRDCGCCF